MQEERQRIEAVCNKAQLCVIVCVRLAVNILLRPLLQFPVHAREFIQHLVDCIAEADTAERGRILRRHIEKLIVAHIAAPVHFHQLRCLVTVLPEAIGNILAVQKQIAVLIGCKRTCDFFHLRLRHAGLHAVCARQLPFLQGLRHIIRSVVRKRREGRLFDVQLRMAQKNRLAVLHIKAERVLPKPRQVLCLAANNFIAVPIPLHIIEQIAVPHPAVLHIVNLFSADICRQDAVEPCKWSVIYAT